MTTRAGTAGLITGMALTIMIYPLYSAWRMAIKAGQVTGSYYIWIVLISVFLVITTGGIWGARWAGSVEKGRRVALGAMTGTLAGTILFCLWGAAAAGELIDTGPLTGSVWQMQAAKIRLITGRTMMLYLFLFLGGGAAGALGGYISTPKGPRQKDVFDLEEPQMALNASITAVPASMVAAVISAVIFPRLASSVNGPVLRTVTEMDLPVILSLLLVVVSHFALTLVVPFEARAANHRCGIDEVKMGAFVGIATAPVLAVLLLIPRRDVFSNPVILIGMLAVSTMSLISVLTLITLILPRRASFKAPPEKHLQIEASLFGTIARSQGPRLIVLCIGCGFLIVLPLYITVVSVLINLSPLLDPASFSFLPPGNWRMFQIQALVSVGMMVASAGFLSAIYIFYLNLGRWYSRWNAKRVK